jgi:hypothetical protein
MRLKLFAVEQQSMQQNLACIFKWLQRYNDGHQGFPHMQVHDYSRDLSMAQHTHNLDIHLVGATT